MTPLLLTLWTVPFAWLIVVRARLVVAPADFGGLTVYRRGGHDERFETPRSDVTRVRPPYFDGVVVPSARGADSVRRAAQTARNAGVPLVVLASGRTDAREVRRLLGDHVLVVTDDVAQQWSRSTDVSRKRNAGLVIARQMGWRTVLFVDDDVQTIDCADLAHAAALLAGVDQGGVPRRLVGWTFHDFRDFSAVGHADAHDEVSFIGGGAMAVCCDEPVFFPAVYNEDVLVALTLLRDDPTSVCSAGSLRQDAYDPFGDVERVAEQEFGEVLLEGLRRRPSDAERPEFWESVLLERQALIDRATQRLADNGMTDGVRTMRVARSQHGRDWPELLAGFVRDWRSDAAAWAEFIRDLRPTRAVSFPAMSSQAS